MRQPKFDKQDHKLSGKYTLSWYQENGCLLQKGTDMLPEIYNLTQGEPCDGCAMWNECTPQKLDAERRQAAINIEKAQKKWQRDHPYGAETNAQIAERLGISKRQVSKCRREGTLEALEQEYRENLK